LAYFLRRSSLDLVGIARATKDDLTPAGEKFCEVLRQLAGTSSRITSVKSENDPILTFGQKQKGVNKQRSQVSRSCGKTKLR
jgi:hypothetical protein